MTTATVTAPIQPGTWTIDPVHSTVGFWVKHLMVSKVRGKFENFSGAITVAQDPQQLRRRKPIVFQRHEHAGEELARNLSTFQLMMFGVGATIGTGIFFVLPEAIPVAGPAVIISFIIAAVTPIQFFS